MRKILTTLLIAMTMAVMMPVNAQVEGMTREQFREYKEAYLKQEMRLVDNVAERFFPIYEEYQDKKQKIYSETQALMDKADVATEAEYKEIIRRLRALERAGSNLEDEYLQKFKTVLTYEQIFKLGKAETKFQKHILKELTRSKNSRARK